MFLGLDSSNDGFLTVDELQNGMASVLGVMRAGSQDWNDLVHQLDTNRDGKIDYGEFITAAVNRARLLNEDNLRIVFNMFDKDGNGTINSADLRVVYDCSKHPKVISGEMTAEEVLVEFLASFGDKNGDGIITKEE